MSKWLKSTMNKFETFLRKISPAPNILSWLLKLLFKKLHESLVYLFHMAFFLTIHTLDIRTCSSEDDGLSLPDATMHSVNCTKDVLQLMEAGEVNRAVSSTSMNNRSSRSHRYMTQNYSFINMELLLCDLN